jgi:hypothetical protein
MPYIVSSANTQGEAPIEKAMVPLKAFTRLLTRTPNTPELM